MLEQQIFSFRPGTASRFVSEIRRRLGAKAEVVSTRGGKYQVQVTFRESDGPHLVFIAKHAAKLDRDGEEIKMATKSQKVLAQELESDMEIRVDGKIQKIDNVKDYGDGHVAVTYYNGRVGVFRHNEPIEAVYYDDIEMAAPPPKPTSKIVDDAQKRVIQARGMPFPIVEAPPFDLAEIFDDGKSFTKQIPISLIVATQRNFNVGQVLGLMKATRISPVDAIFYKGKYYLVNGHHRAIAAAYNGEETLLAEVVTYRATA